MFNYVGNDLIKKDLKRLKRLISLGDDITNSYLILMGKLTDVLSHNMFSSPLGDFLTEKSIKGFNFRFYKKSINISNPKLSSSSGARLIFGVQEEKRKFIPILVYSASEEKKHYFINQKKLPLTKPGLIKIIDEKIEEMKEQ